MNGRIIAGISLILISIAYIMGELGVFDFWKVLWNFSPSILILIGIIHLVNMRNSLLNSLALIIFGVILQAAMIDLLPLSLWSAILASALIIIGLSMLINDRNRNKNSDDRPYSDGNSTHIISIFSLFSGAKRVVSSKDFAGGNVSTLFGGAEVDLRDAELHEDRAFIEVSCMFGGCELRVPENWEIELNGIPILGGASDKTRPVISGDLPRPKLSVRYFVIFGGFEIKN